MVYVIGYVIAYVMAYVMTYVIVYVMAYAIRLGHKVSGVIPVFVRSEGKFATHCIAYDLQATDGGQSIVTQTGFQQENLRTKCVCPCEQMENPHLRTRVRGA